MNLAQQILEMASPYRGEFEPGYRVFVRRGEHEGVPPMGRYVIGTSGKDRGLFSVSSSSSVPQLVPDERINKLLDKKFDNFEEIEEDVIQALLDHGYEEITEVERGKTQYAGGELIEEGTVQPYEGTLYHGTEDVFFFTTTYGEGNLSFGHDLQSLQGGVVFVYDSRGLPRTT